MSNGGFTHQRRGHRRRHKDLGIVSEFRDEAFNVVRVGRLELALDDSFRSHLATAPPANDLNMDRGSAAGELHAPILRPFETSYLGRRGVIGHETHPAITATIHAGFKQSITTTFGGE